MRIFVGEYVCGGGLTDTDLDSIPASLRLEGTAMLRAIVTDLSEFAQTIVPIDSRMNVAVDPTETITIDREVPLWNQWLQAAKDCDAAIIVAPESEGVLAKGVAMLRAGGIDVVASSGDFLRIASDKFLTAKTLLARGVAHPPYVVTSDLKYEDEVCRARKFVLKPRDGCGTQEILVFDSYQQAREQLQDHQILQPWIEGRAVSIAMIASPSQQTILPVVSQTFNEGTCEYAGGCGPLDVDAQRRATALASRAIDAMPPTVRGFVGLDLLLGDRPSEDCVIEINPRLTTSYVGLRKMINGNLAARFFDIETGPVACAVGLDSVRWSRDGKVWTDELATDQA